MWRKQPIESLAIRASVASQRKNSRLGYAATADDDPSDLGRVDAAIESWPTQSDFNDGGEFDHLQAVEGMWNAINMSAPIWAFGLLLAIWWVG
jgi:hypothetical protein